MPSPHLEDADGNFLTVSSEGDKPSEHPKSEEEDTKKALDAQKEENQAQVSRLESSVNASALAEYGPMSGAKDNKIVELKQQLGETFPPPPGSVSHLPPGGGASHTDEPACTVVQR